MNGIEHEMVLDFRRKMENIPKILILHRDPCGGLSRYFCTLRILERQPSNVSLFRYKVTLTDGGVKEGRITAKSEQSARERLEKMLLIQKWHSIRVESQLPSGSNANPAPRPQVTPNSEPVSKPASPASKPMTKLQQLLYVQQGRCFFCGEELSETDASIEHLYPKSKGGNNERDNLVVCHTTLNQAFGDMGLKQKFEFVLNHVGAVKCPKNDSTKAAASPASTKLVAADSAQKQVIPTPQPTKTQPAKQPKTKQPTSAIDTVIANLKGRGKSRPRKLKTLTSTIKSLALKLNDQQVANVIDQLKLRGTIIITGTQVAYHF